MGSELGFCMYNVMSLPVELCLQGQSSIAFKYLLEENYAVKNVI